MASLTSEWRLAALFCSADRSMLDSMELLGTCVAPQTKEDYLMHLLEVGLAVALCVDVGVRGWMRGC